MFMMRNLYILGIMVCLLAGICSCNTQALRDLDDPKYMVTTANADLGMIFTDIEVKYTRRSALTALRIPAGYTKYYATHSTIMPGDRYQFDTQYFPEPWNVYTDEGKEVIHLLDLLEKMDDQEMINNIAILKILKGAIFSWVTDLYGDVPYSEAGLAYLEGNLYPKYDTQESIYKSILSMLDEACNSFDANKPVWSKYDIIYNGNHTKWKQFGYSLMLRMAMRMAAIDPATAQQYAEKAIAGGVILDNVDNFQIICVDNQNSERNPVAYGMIFNDPEKYWKLGADFVNALKDNDPRANIILGGTLKKDKPVPNSGIMNTYWFDDSAWDYTLSEQEGHPHGQDVQVTTYELIQKSYSRPSRYLFDYNSPIVRLAAHEMYFCIAKAYSLGWNTGGQSDKEMYESGVRASMKFYSEFEGVYEISDDEIDDYLNYRPYTPDNLLHELWISNYLDPFQAWFYIRQWGPDLTPNVSGIAMPRRMPYITNEQTRNKENYTNALNQMGMPSDISSVDQMAYRCWWDVRQ
jgi:hypothetical protein